MFGKERQGGRNDDILRGNALSTVREVGIHTICSGDHENNNLARREDSLKDFGFKSWEIDCGGI